MHYDEWRHPHAFFKEEATETTKPWTAARDKAQKIYDVLNSGTAKVCTLFLKYAVSIFEPFLTANQSDAPQVHMLHFNINKLMREVLIKFIKPSGMANELPSEVEFTLPYYRKEDQNISIGQEAENYMDAQKYSKEKKTSFYNHVVNFYSYVCIYLKENLPHDSMDLKRLAVVKPSFMVLDGALSELKALMKKWPCLIPPESNPDILETQFCRLQTMIVEEKLPVGDRLDKIWALQAKDCEDTRDACIFLLNCLVIPHSSAPCERVFSHVRKVKTDQRKLKGDELLEATIIIKHIPTHALERSHTHEEYRKLKKATMESLQQMEVLEPATSTSQD